MDEPKTTTTDVTPAPVLESTYTRRELMAASYNAFGVAPEVVAGALHLSRKQELTRAETEAAIKQFLERKV